jgi:hypothetical protein
VPAPLKAAESAMVSDFLAMTSEATSMPDPTSLERLPSDGPTWLFFRTYCRWRVDKFTARWRDLSGACPSPEDQRCPEVSTDRRKLLERLPAATRGLVDFAAALNVLNLCLEPTLSFKGGPGLIHAEVFRSAEDLADSPLARQLVLDRDHLLDQLLPTGKKEF